MEVATVFSDSEVVDPAAFLLYSRSSPVPQVQQATHSSQFEHCRIIYDGSIEQDVYYDRPVEVASVSFPQPASATLPRPAPIVVHDGGIEEYIEEPPKSPTGVFQERLGQWW